MKIIPDPTEPLFADRHLGTLLNNQILKAEDWIEHFHVEQLLISPIDDIVDVALEKFSLTPLVLHRDKGRSEVPVEQNLYSPVLNDYEFRGFGYELVVPFTGSQGLFRHRPDVFTTEPPRAHVNEDGVHVKVLAEGATEADVEREMNRELERIETYIGYQALQLGPFDHELRTRCRRQVSERKARVLEARRVAASLGYPMRRWDDDPIPVIAPIVRRPLPPSLTMPPNTKFEPEYAIEESEYQHILEVMGRMATAMERTPSAFRRIKEEELRDFFLVALNGHYQGGASGETFNVGGKTDILIRANGKNVFVAECKYWRGATKFPAAIDQLLGYLGWRDTKTALIVFNRNKEATSVRDNIWRLVEAHPNMKRGPDREGLTRARYIFSHPNDTQRELVMTVMIFDVPEP